MSNPLPNGLKELLPTGYLGIDFGTSTTHIAVCYVDGNIVPQTVPLAGKSSVMTCLLWKEPGTPDEEVVTYGEKALRLWSSMPEEQRKRHRFAAVFKPDIANGPRSSTAQNDARAFLRKCYQAVSEGGVVRAIGSEEGMPVVIGIPAEIGQEQKDLTARLAREAGFGEAVSVEEPLGALAFHLADGSVTAAEARQGVVIVDFGGGTLDVAWLDARHGLRTPWGDPTMGGRLFDDLFYQWLLDQNPELDLDERDRVYVWQASCRELKERFSDHWEEDGENTEYVDTLKLPGRRFAEFTGTIMEFRQRAARYAPTDVAAAYFASIGGRLASLGQAGPEDLIGLIRRELIRGFGGQPRDVARVILTGGSCKWPFMRDLASLAFGVDRDRVLRSPQPDTTVGSGLAVYHVLKFRNAQKQRKLNEELPEYKRRFEEAVSARISRFTEEAASAVVTPLMSHVEQVYLNWYRRGGTLNGVQQDVQAFTNQFDVGERLKGRDALLAKDLVRLVRDHLRVWLKEHGIDREVDEVVPEGSITVPVPPLSAHSGEIAKVISDMVAVALVGSVFVIVYTAVHGAHILVHPLTGVPTAMISAAASALGFTMIEDKIRDQVMAFEWGEISLKGLSAVLSEQSLREKIASSRAETTGRVVRVLGQGQGSGASTRVTATTSSGQKWQTLAELQHAVVAQFEQVVSQVIKDLGVLEEIREVRT
jgi:molecular chaperone DnaK